jgi:MoaA/NifB/PqqE/SkfB family radical SAM enzyme
MQWSKRVQFIQVDPTSYCNAKCVSCVRNIDGGDTIPHLQLNHIDPKVWDRVMSEDTKGSLFKKIHFNGVWGDACMHPELIAICESIVTHHPEASIGIATNGSMRDTKWWEKLSKVLQRAKSHKIEFAIDGLEDTHHLYRRNTSFKKICENVKAFNDVGGNAEIITTAFDYNVEQLDAITQLATDLGCCSHGIRPSFAKNETLEVYDKSYKISHDKVKNFKRKNIILKEDKYKTTYIPEQAELDTPCIWYQDMRIQIDPWGTVWPCCWTATRAPQAKAEPFDMPGFDPQVNNIYENKLLDILSNSWYNKRLSSIIDNRESVVCNKFCINKTKVTNRTR